MHGLLWFKNAPKFQFENLSDLQKDVLRLYFEEFCFAINPNLNLTGPCPCHKNFTDIESSEDILAI